jgi:hypothetical protein
VRYSLYPHEWLLVSTYLCPEKGWVNVLRFICTTLLCPFRPVTRRGIEQSEDLIHLVPSSGATAHDGSETTKNRLIIDPQYRHFQKKLSSRNKIISRIWKTTPKFQCMLCDPEKWTQRWDEVFILGVNYYLPPRNTNKRCWHRGSHNLGWLYRHYSTRRDVLWSKMQCRCAV